MSINQRFEMMLKNEKISQINFCEITGMNERTVSNIKTITASIR